MSRELPQKPNLEYLRKQAKELLRNKGQGKLADAQHALALDYGFATWAKLKSHIESLQLTPAEALRVAVCDGDAKRVRVLLDRHSELRATIDDPLPNYGFGQHALFAAAQRSDRVIIDVLLKCRRRYPQANRVVGRRIRRTGRLRSRPGEFSRGTRRGTGCAFRRATGMDDRAARTGGGRSFSSARTRRRWADAAALCLDSRGGAVPSRNGADIDALDTGHDSTPAQYMLRVQQKRHYPRDRQEVARYLVSRGCKTDLLMAVALGDGNLVLRHLESDPACIRLNVSEQWFPKRDPRAGGTIYLLNFGICIAPPTP